MRQVVLSLSLTRPPRLQLPRPASRPLQLQRRPCSRAASAPLAVVHAAGAARRGHRARRVPSRSGSQARSASSGGRRPACSRHGAARSARVSSTERRLWRSSQRSSRRGVELVVVGARRRRRRPRSPTGVRLTVKSESRFGSTVICRAGAGWWPGRARAACRSRRAATGRKNWPALSDERHEAAAADPLPKSEIERAGDRAPAGALDPAHEPAAVVRRRARRTSGAARRRRRPRQPEPGSELNALTSSGMRDPLPELDRYQSLQALSIAGAGRGVPGARPPSDVDAAARALCYKGAPGQRPPWRKIYRRDRAAVGRAADLPRRPAASDRATHRIGRREPRTTSRGSRWAPTPGPTWTRRYHFLAGRGHGRRAAARDPDGQGPRGRDRRPASAVERARPGGARPARRPARAAEDAHVGPAAAAGLPGGLRLPHRATPRCTWPRPASSSWASTTSRSSSFGSTRLPGPPRPAGGGGRDRRRASTSRRSSRASTT